MPIFFAPAPAALPVPWTWWLIDAAGSELVAILSAAAGSGFFIFGLNEIAAQKEHAEWVQLGDGWFQFDQGGIVVRVFPVWNRDP